MEISGYLEKKLVAWRAGERTKSKPVAAPLLATAFGLGYLPVAPGTWASIATTVAWFGLYQWSIEAVFWLHIFVLISLSPIAVWASDRTARVMKDPDPHQVVIDEVLGQSVTLLAAPVEWYWFLAALAAFRVFDIVKPSPVRQLERVSGGWGILLDDMMAGVYGCLLIGLWVYAS
ncbi:MAG TPA: phosphatidylglycerophosphatase A [Acidobacteriota bacterium]|nr:phosphatidylglycerophosphatase A [Acidobacteriota bacterium]